MWTEVWRGWDAVCTGRSLWERRGQQPEFSMTFGMTFLPRGHFNL